MVPVLRFRGDQAIDRRGGGAVTEPAGRRATLERVAREQARAVDDLTRRLGEVRGHGADADGLIQVEVATGGRVTDLRLHPRAMRLDSETLAEQIMAAIDAAVADAGQQVQDAVGAATGPSWADLAAGAAPDTSMPLPPIPDAATLADLVRRGRPGGASADNIG
jgi:DNA-binding protein YbaB